MSDKPLPILIVGGGLAGLSAAYELRLQGLSSLVLEAGQRVGGRVHSVSTPGGSRLDGGGELIGLHHRCWLGYAQRFNLDLVDSLCGDGGGHGRREAAFTERSQLSRDASSVLPEQPWLSKDAESWDYLSVASWIASLKISARAF